MNKIPMWQKARMKVHLKKRMKNLYKQAYVPLFDIKELIADLIESTPEEDHLNIVIIVCSEVISGFDEKKERDFVLEMVKNVVKNIE